MVGGGEDWEKTVYDRPSMILPLRTTQLLYFTQTYRTRPVITIINMPAMIVKNINHIFHENLSLNTRYSRFVTDFFVSLILWNFATRLAPLGFIGAEDGQNNELW